MTRVGTVQSVYVDGAFVISDTDAAVDDTVSNSEPLEIALENQAEKFNFPGTIDDVRIYNRALSASEVKQLYKLGQATIKQ